MAHTTASAGPSSIILLASAEEAESFNIHKCIICQEDNKTPVTSEKKGRARMKRAAKIREDHVVKRMRILDGGIEEDNDNANFVYHNTNECYKTYTHSGKLKSIEDKKTKMEKSTVCESTEEETTTAGSSKNLRKSVVPCAPPSCNVDPKTLTCVVCGHIEHRNIRDKHRICEYDSARDLIEAARHNEDDVFTRIAHCLKDDEENSVKSVISADLFCHKRCRHNYARKYKRDVKPKPVTGISNIKHVLFLRVVPYIDKLLARGEFCLMSDIVAFATRLLNVGEDLTSEFRIRDMKQLIVSHYGDSVTIAPNARQNESDILFSSEINAANLATKIKNQNIMRDAGNQLREVLLNVDFGLQDSFCDSSDLKASWERTIMPAPLLTFLAALYKIPKCELFQSSVSDFEELLESVDDDEGTLTEDELPQEINSSHVEKQEDWMRDHKNTQLHCLFQVLVNNLHHGAKRTPLHMMLGHALYARDRSKSLLTAFNRIGACASYQTIRSSRSLLASYAVKRSEDGETPIPCTFTRDDYTMGGMDNSDYADKTSLSGTKSSHYAAMVLFQDSTVNTVNHKPSVSESGLSRHEPLLRSKLPCQEVPPHVKPVFRPLLPQNMLLHPEIKEATLINTETARTQAEREEFAIHLIRIGASTEDPLIWNAVHTLVSSATVPLMRVGFLPVVPRPITERATVRHCLNNFKSVRRQLNQTSMAIWCDEGVFALAMDIILHEQETFNDLFICMGPFHWTRVLLRCQGKLLRGSGVDDTLVECAVFGPGVIESALNGKHYVRALTGMLIVEDAIRSLQWQMFWRTKANAKYPVMEQVRAVQNLLTENKRCPEQFQALVQAIDSIQNDFLEFEKECVAKSEVCKFFGLWLNVVAIIKHAIVSDREGNWDLHVATVTDSMPLFAEFDCINYMRHGSWYLEQIKVLEFTHPDLYRRFALGQWVVQSREGWFCAVAGDMKLEQTIQRVSKGPGGHYVVGTTRNAAAVAEFELLFHEIGTITSLLDFLTTNQSMQHTEYHLQHALSKSRRLTFNQNVARLLDFVKERQNPFSVTQNVPVPVPLHNLLTQEAVDKNVAERLLKCLENGEIVYTLYRQEVFIKRTKKISTSITKRKLPCFNDHPQKTPSTSKRIATEKTVLTTKDIAEAQRNMDIARERGMSLSLILCHDMFATSPIFDGDLPAQVNKSQLVGEIEQTLDVTKWSPGSSLETHVVVDFMSKMRQMPITKFPTLGAVTDAVISSSLGVCKDPAVIHVVLDSYIEMSLKEGERLRRANTMGIDIIGMNRDTPIPQQIDKFWASDENKKNLQLLVRNTVHNYMNNTATIIVSSVIFNDELLPAITAKGEEIPDLLNWIEEADARLIVHVAWAVRSKQCKRIIVISNDTDTFALLLHFTSFLQELGLQEMWQQFGTGEKRRMLPLHQAVTILGAPLASTVIKAHILTGDDCMSKVGTKHAAITCEPVKFLANFGEADSVSERDAALAEKYLVRVWAGVKSTSHVETFDELRIETYKSASCGIASLPPTSSVIRGHIQRGAFLVNNACNLLTQAQDSFRNEPTQHGWEEHFGTLLPSKNLKPFPRHILTMCNCAGRCDTRRCRCRAAGLPCITFCHGKTRSVACENLPTASHDI